MQHQLVLQFRGSTLEDLDAIVALEERLTIHLAGVAKVDGHDIGSDEANIFIITSDPIGTFGAIRPVLDHANLLTGATVAYRPSSGNDYSVLWPAQSDEVFRVA
ncbi:MAG TPA: ABC transporter [Casimicrobiaceae bacterium]|nr:ABC transporter [Casimicrobiaceae bacterium]